MNEIDALKALRPRLIGEDWSAYEGCSALGVVVRMARLNYLHGGDIRASLGLTIRRKENLLRGLLQSGAKHEALARMLGFGEAFVEDWRLETWWPFRSEPSWDALTSKMRLCPICALNGYHSALFQLPGVDVCPWHRVKLIEGCHRCNRPLLDGFDRGLALLQCTCGHDHVDLTRSIAGDQYAVANKHQELQEYRSWARRKQASSWLFGPDLWDQKAWVALEALIESPKAIRPQTERGLVVDEIVTHNGISPSDWLVASDSGLEQARPSIVKLPGTWLRSLQSITRRAAQMPGPGHLSAPEYRALGVAPVPAPSGSAVDGTRFDILRLKASSVGPDIYLHTGVLEGTVLMALGRIADGLGTDPVPRTDSQARREFRLAVKQHPVGHQLVSRVLHRALNRSYADGCRIVLGQVDPNLYRNRSTRPVRRFPWISLTLGDDHAHAKIVWTRQPDQ